MTITLFQFVAFWATLLLEGSEGVPINYEKAYKLAEIGVKNGCPACSGVLARCLYNGKGCTQDETLSLQLAQKSAASGSHFGYFMVGWKNYDDGDYANAFQMWQMAAELGLAAAQVNLGFMLSNGEGVPKDEHKSFQLYQMAANQKHPEGYLNLSRMYSRGIGVKLDIDEASRYAQLARQAGNSKWLFA
jgi:TPR repeat protein